MALIVEDGTGKPNAESYISEDDATAYHEKRGNADAWDAIDNKEAALINATEFMGQKYRMIWAGVRAKVDQALDWPRYDVPRVDGPGGYGAYPDYYSFTEVPVEVGRACAELALRTADGPLMVDLDRAIQTETIGPLSTTYFSADGQQKRFSAVDSILAPLIGAKAYSLRVTRA